MYVAGLQEHYSNYKATVAYDGTNYNGYQLQPGVPTIQGEIEQCLGTILQMDRESLGLTGSGRTDAGVHAKGQVLHHNIQENCFSMLL